MDLPQEGWRGKLQGEGYQVWLDIVDDIWCVSGLLRNREKPIVFIIRGGSYI